MHICLSVLCGHLLGKSWPLGSRLWCLTVSLSLSHWYPGSGVVLDCIDSWSLHPYLLRWTDCPAMTIAVDFERKAKLEDLKVLKRSPDLLNNVKIGHSQLDLLLKHILLYPIWAWWPFWLSIIFIFWNLHMKFEFKQPSDFGGKMMFRYVAVQNEWPWMKGHRSAWPLVLK